MACAGSGKGKPPTVIRLELLFIHPHRRLSEDMENNNMMRAYTRFRN